MSNESDQLHYLVADVKAMVNGRWWRWLSVPCQAGMISIMGYRISRLCWLALGDRWKIIHTLLAPARLVLRPLGAGLELHYEADIGPGLRILHPSLGIVISGEARIGRDLTLTGGNCIGTRPRAVPGSLRIGDGVNVGANAVILGPAVLGDQVVVGAGSVVVDDVPSGVVVVGAPARAADGRTI